MEGSQAIDFRALRAQGKGLFKQGKVKESFNFLNDECLEKARVSGTQFDLLESLITIARLRQEIGEYPKADINLDEAKQILTSKEDELK